jgi:prophage DNA circulation protein
VALNVKFLSNQQKASQLDAEIALEKTDLKEVSVEVEAEVSVETEALAEIVDLIEAQEKCIKQFVLSVERTVKFLSNQQKASRFYVKTVL